MSSNSAPTSRCPGRCLRNEYWMISFGLLGCGRIAARHAKLLGNGEIAGARLSAVCDVAGERARQYGERFGVPAFDDPERLFAHPNVDVVSILTPSGLHVSHTVAAARAGKHIVVEKPMALQLWRARGRNDSRVRPPPRAALRSEAKPLQRACRQVAPGAGGRPIRQIGPRHGARAVVPPPGLLRSGTHGAALGRSTAAF